MSTADGQRMDRRCVGCGCMTATVADPDGVLCKSCRRLYNQAGEAPQPKHALPNGRWMREGLKRVWVEIHPIPQTIDNVSRAVIIHGLLACPTCKARLDESCKSKGGNPREPHVTRIVSRICPCGQPVAYKKLLCEECRVEARRRTYALREQRTPTTQRRKAA